MTTPSPIDTDTAPPARPRTRIQMRNREAILSAALDVFSVEGFTGATLDRIATQAGLSKPNLLYYFASKEAIYVELLDTLMSTWLDPLRALDPAGDPVEEIVAYVRRKLAMSREYPRESRLFALEIVQGAPRIGSRIEGELRALVDEKAAVIENWAKNERLAPLDARHLIFSIWSTTQHYADFDVQVASILGARDRSRYDDADTFLASMFRAALSPT